jgi:hypothetical protein
MTTANEKSHDKVVETELKIWEEAQNG